MIAVIEAITWTGLLVGMFLKYVTETTELGVYVFGRLHGAAFVLYVIVTAVAAIPPLATLPLEVGLRRRGYLRQPADAADGGARTTAVSTSDSASARG
ncbi:MAG: DUF3817 domain-containing protein [Clavibacter sp.]|nr:DUF3817 domain-containing protein [Clavibacter sp.]